MFASSEPSLISCLLCRGVLPSPIEEMEVFISHMRDQHRAYFNLDFFGVAFSLDEYGVVKTKDFMENYARTGVALSRTSVTLTLTEDENSSQISGESTDRKENTEILEENEDKPVIKTKKPHTIEKSYAKSVNDDDEEKKDFKPIVEKKLDVTRMMCGCNIKFSSRKEKILHNRIVHKNYFQCETCKKTYKEGDDYQIHIQKHAKKIKNNSNICEDCGFVAVNKYNLKGHKDLKHDKQMLICDICSREFQGKLRLKIHRRRFHRSREQCQECGGVYKNLTKHKRTIHTKESEKKYQCDHCAKGFIDKNRKDVHIQSVHMKKKPFICRFDCGYACADGGNRLKHEKLRHGENFVKTEMLQKSLCYE